MHESDDKADVYIKEQISDNFQNVLSFLSQMSCKIKFGSYQERGGISLPTEILDDFENGSILAKDEDQLDKTENMLNIFFKNAYRDIMKVYYRRAKNENRISYHLMQTKMIAGKAREIPFSMESTGTQALLELLPFMLVSVAGSVTVIDEFDTGVHDLLVKKLVQSLYKNVSGQLIMTTHNTLLMESDIPKECFYVINELPDGSKEIKTLTYYDQKIHENTNIRKQYIEGKYRGVPESSDIDFVELLSELGI
jgi:AAA15 family ATPase/GTPase